MSSGSEVLGDRTIGRQEALSMTCRLKPLHTALALTCRPMRVLTRIIEIAALTMLYAREHLALRRAIAFEFISDDHAWDVEQAFEELAEELLGRLLIAPPLHEDVEDVIVLIDCPPQVMPLTMFEQEFLHIAVAQGEPIGEPDTVADDFDGEAVVFVTLGVGGRGHVTLPILVCNGSWRGHHRGDYAIAQAGWTAS